MSNLIYTISINDKFKKVSDYTIPLMQEYAKKCDCDFYISKHQLDYEHPFFVKYEIGKLLDKHDRILFIDADVAIRDNAPNVFNVVPDNKLGVYVESENVPERLSQCNFFWNLNKLKHNGCKRMFNTGVMLFSQCHKDIIKPHPPHITMNKLGRFADEIWFNYIFKDTDLYRLSHKWNHMDLSGKPDNESIYFRHYAAGDRKKLLKII